MATLAQFRCAVEGPERLASLRNADLPLRLSAAEPVRAFHRDIYLDTSDRALSQRGATCRLRVQADDQRFLALIVEGANRLPERWEAAVTELDARRALEGTTEPARRLRGLIDPSLLKPRLEIETERWTRVVSSGWFRKVPRFAFLYDACTVRHGGLARDFQELQVRRLAPGGPHLEQLSQALERAHGLRPVVFSKLQRAEQLIEAMAGEATVRLLATQRSVALIAFDGTAIAFERDEAGALAIPVARGSGEESCRYLLRQLLDSGVGELTLLGQTTGSDDRPTLEVWVARKIRARAGHNGKVEWLSLNDALAKVGTELKSPETLGALALVARGNLLAERPRVSSETPGVRTSARTTGPSDAAPTPSRPKAKDRFVSSSAPADHFFNVELSQIAFHERVLELGSDPTVPLAERLRYLAIVSANLDEFFSVRVGALKVAIAGGSTRRSFDGLSPLEQFDAIAARVPGLIDRQSVAAAEALAHLGERGVHLRRWIDLSTPEQGALARYFESELKPLITPRAVTLSPGHPFPVIPPLVIAFAVLVRDIHTGPVHFAYLPIPARINRLIPVPETGGFVLVEDLVRAHLQDFYPERPVEQAWAFRITRTADLDVNEEDAGDLLQAIEEEVGRRSRNATARVEVQRGMPPFVRDLLLKELRFERRDLVVPLGESDLYEVEGPLDLTFVRALAAKAPASDQYPPFAGRDPFPATRPLFELIDEADRLVHHPFEDFEACVGRFLREAAADPSVAAIKMTLYRTGEQSPIVDALIAAGKAGKDVSVFIELKARFDEVRNARWVKELESAHVQVVYGLVGLKTHAKILLVIRETDRGLKRYAHIGTGNYNAGTAKFYTDLGLFTADSGITGDLVDLFNQLTGSSGAPAGNFRKLIVSPGSMVAELVRRIEREIELAETGKPARIRAQVNGLEDPELIGSLYRASRAGVEIDLVVRGLSVLRPGVPGLSDRIRVKSILGRFLEHQRIYHFGNGGDGRDEYFIGSADLRPRNLRRRVEVLTPVESPNLKARLDEILRALLEEPTAWSLTADGRYLRGPVSAEVPHIHARLLAESRSA